VLIVTNRMKNHSNTWRPPRKQHPTHTPYASRGGWSLVAPFGRYWGDISQSNQLTANGSDTCCSVL